MKTDHPANAIGDVSLLPLPLQFRGKGGVCRVDKPQQRHLTARSVQTPRQFDGQRSGGAPSDQVVWPLRLHLPDLVHIPGYAIRQRGHALAIVLAFVQSIQRAIRFLIPCESDHRSDTNAR